MSLLTLRDQRFFIVIIIQIVKSFVYVLNRIYDSSIRLLDHLEYLIDPSSVRFQYANVFEEALNCSSFCYSIDRLFNDSSCYHFIQQLNNVYNEASASDDPVNYSEEIETFLTKFHETSKYRPSPREEYRDLFDSVLQTSYSSALFDHCKLNDLLSIADDLITFEYINKNDVRIRITHPDNTSVVSTLPIRDVYLCLIAIQVCVYSYISPPMPSILSQHSVTNHVELLSALRHIAFYTSRPPAPTHTMSYKRPRILPSKGTCTPSPWHERPKYCNSILHTSQYITQTVQSFLRAYSYSSYAQRLAIPVGTLHVHSSTHAFKAHQRTPPRIQTGIEYTIPLNQVFHILAMLDPKRTRNNVPGEFEPALNTLQQMIKRIQELPHEIVSNILLQSIFSPFFTCQCRYLECIRKPSIHDEYCKIGRTRPNARRPRFFPCKIYVHKDISKAYPTLSATVLGIVTSEPRIRFFPQLHAPTRPKHPLGSQSSKHIILSPIHGQFMTLDCEHLDSQQSIQHATDPHPMFPLLPNSFTLRDICQCTRTTNSFLPYSKKNPDHLMVFD
jgi:hypothetical protein